MDDDIPSSPWPGITFAERYNPKISRFERNYKMRQVQQTKDELTKLFNQYTEKSLQQIHAKVKQPTDGEKINNQPQVNFCLEKVRKIEQNLQKIHETYYSGVASQVSRIICFFSECEQKGFIPFCNVEKLMSDVDKMSYQSRSVKRKLRELEYYLTYINSHNFVPRLPAVPLEHIIPLISDVAKYSELTYHYVKPNIFDTFYSDFIITSGKKNLFLEALDKVLTPPLPEQTQSSPITPKKKQLKVFIGDSVKVIKHDDDKAETEQNQESSEIKTENEISKSDNESLQVEAKHPIQKEQNETPKIEKQKTEDLINASFFQNFINQQTEFFTLSSREESLVVECSAIRLFFDFYYSRFPTFIFPSKYEKDLNQKFNEEDLLIQKNCELLRKMSPKMLQTRTDLFPPSLYDKSFTEICKKSPEIAESVRIISSLCFYNNPLDILAETFHALKNVENFVLSNSESKESRSMSFDDFFGIFFPVFSIEPPLNSSILLYFMELFGKLNYSMPFQFAYAILTSTISFIRDFDESKLSSENIKTS